MIEHETNLERYIGDYLARVSPRNAEELDIAIKTIGQKMCRIMAEELSELRDSYMKLLS